MSKKDGHMQTIQFVWLQVVHVMHDFDHIHHIAAQFVLNTAIGGLLYGLYGYLW